MSKPRGVRWLEETTGQQLDRQTDGAGDLRHLSLRIPVTLYLQLEDLAERREETVSKIVRSLLTDSLASQATPTREAIDAAIAILEDARRGLPAAAA